jgi:hypothetical protein
LSGRSIQARRTVIHQDERVKKLTRKGLDTTRAARTLEVFARRLDIFQDGEGFKAPLES